MFGRRFRVFRLAGLDVHIDVSWFVIALLFTWALSSLFCRLIPELQGRPGVLWAMCLAGMLLFFLSIVLHELGHAVTARRFGIHMRGITLFIFGGVAEMADEPPSP